MKKLVLFSLVISAVLFIDYFVISLVGILANLCKVGCGFYENTFGLICWTILGLSMVFTTYLFSRKALG